MMMMANPRSLRLPTGVRVSRLVAFFCVSRCFLSGAWLLLLFNLRIYSSASRTDPPMRLKRAKMGREAGGDVILEVRQVSVVSSPSRSPHFFSSLFAPKHPNSKIQTVRRFF